MRPRIGLLATLALLATVVLVAIAAFGQIPSQQPDEPQSGSGGFRRESRRSEWRPKRMPSRSEFPVWDVDSRFREDVFTFVRIQYDSIGPFGWWDRWDNDYPDGDWNFSYRLQNLTSLKVASDSRVLRIDDPELFDYPFVYLAGAQTMMLSETEKVAFRRYLLNGGFAMFDDVWGLQGRDNVLRQMQQIFPDQEPRELTLEHPLFHIVYELSALPQVVDIKTWRDGYNYEFMHGDSGGDEAPHFLAYYDDNQRMVALICLNNDIGDGWEREGDDEAYFQRFSEKWSYPLGINIVTYVMTH